MSSGRAQVPERGEEPRRAPGPTADRRLPSGAQGLTARFDLTSSSQTGTGSLKALPFDWFLFLPSPTPTEERAATRYLSPLVPAPGLLHGALSLKPRWLLPSPAPHLEPVALPAAFPVGLFQGRSVSSTWTVFVSSCSSPVPVTAREPGQARGWGSLEGARAPQDIPRGALGQPSVAASTQPPRVSPGESIFSFLFLQPSLLALLCVPLGEGLVTQGEVTPGTAPGKGSGHPRPRAWHPAANPQCRNNGPFSPRDECGGGCACEGQAGWRLSVLRNKPMPSQPGSSAFLPCPGAGEVARHTADTASQRRKGRPRRAATSHSGGVPGAIPTPPRPHAGDRDHSGVGLSPPTYQVGAPGLGSGLQHRPTCGLALKPTIQTAVTKAAAHRAV